MTSAPAAATAAHDGAGELALAQPAATARAEVGRRRAAVRAVADDLLALAAAGPTGDPRRPGDVAAAWLMEFASANTRQAYAADLAAFFVWCAQRPVDVWAVRRYHLAEYLAQPKPDGRPFAPKTLERRLAAICGLYTYALDLALIDRHPRGHGTRLRVDAKRAQGAAALSKAEFERFVAAAREHSPGIVTRLTPHGLRATFITLALNDGAALRDVQDAARHADPRTTRLYDRDAGALNRHPVHRLLGFTSC